MKASRPYAETRKMILKDPKVAALYLEECLKDGNPKMFTNALRYVAEAHGGMALLAKKTGANRVSLYRTLSKDGNPRLKTLTKILAAMDLQLNFVPARPRA